MIRFEEEREELMEKYELVEENIGDGRVAVVKLMRHRETKEHVAVKFMERGHKVHFYFLFFII